MTPQEMKREIESELHSHHIFITHVAKKIGRTRFTVYNWLKDMTPRRYEALKRAIDTILEERK